MEEARFHNFQINLEDQLLLLKCLFSENHNKKQHWEKWKENHDLENFSNQEITKLYPSLYEAIAFVEENKKIIEKFQILFLQTSYQNRLYLNKLKEIIDLFKSEGISTIILKGASLFLQSPTYVGKRSISDLDLLVLEKDFLKAEDLIINKLGYKRTFTDFREHTYDKENSVKIDLHSRLNEWVTIKNEEFWTRSHDALFDQYSFKVLDLTDQFFHVCLHSLSSNMACLYWVSDAMEIYKLANNDINWEMLVKTIEDRQVRNLLVIPLKFLSENNFIPIPGFVFERLDKKNYSLVEKIEEDYLGNFRETFKFYNPIKILLNWFRSYLRIKNDTRYKTPVIGALRFYKQAFGVESWGEFLSFVIYKLAKIPLRFLYRVLTKKSVNF